ncbi:hypothetical protein NEMIN01_1856 [Nematocida minor]|uniref:uncharacterized protein n=1 Tax=Nematocida minor TaxID=1912983 RepID=UPI00221F5C19|nr:uncharacterized protein NEMIN01_1856 [Nematocida minor]KAI5192163.1 hypothetical protein NEMIN01_1856 [Nematocida minor]
MGGVNRTALANSIGRIFHSSKHIKKAVFASILYFACVVSVKPTDGLRDLPLEDGLTLQRTIDVLRHGNADIDPCEVEFNLTKTGEMQMVGLESVHICIDIPKYLEIKDKVHGFDDSILYETVSIVGGQSVKEGKDEEAQSALCLQFIDAFKGIKTDELHISNFSLASKEKELAPTDQHRKASPKYTVEIEKIVFKNVNQQLAIDILRKYVFKCPVTIVFKEMDDITWETLIKIPKSANYRRIEVEKIKNLAQLNEKKLYSLSRIIPFLKITAGSGKDSIMTLGAVGEILFKYFLDTRRTTVSMYKIFLNFKMLATTLESDKSIVLVAENIKDFDVKDRESDEDPFHSEAENCLLDSFSSPLKKSVQDTHSQFFFFSNQYEFEIKIEFKNPQALTLLQLKKVLYWMTQTCRKVTKLTISNLVMSADMLQLFSSIRVSVEDLLYLKYLYLEKINGLETKLMLKNTDYTLNSSTLEKIHFDPHSLYPTCLPMHMYIKNSISKKVNADSSNVPDLSVLYPGVSVDDELVACMVCPLNVFRYQDGKKGFETTESAISLQEIENMTWEEFCECKNKNHIEKHLMYADIKDIDKITKENFCNAVSYFSRIPLVIFPVCKHTMCVRCLNGGKEHLKREIEAELEMQNFTNIECPMCRQINMFDSSIQYPVYVTKRSPADDDWIYSASRTHSEPENNGATTDEIMFFRCSGFKPKEYYMERIPYLAKQDLFLRKK